MNNSEGLKITSKKNGNSIFLPAATSNSGYSRLGYYWSRSLYATYSCYAYYLSFNSSDIYTSSYYRSYGQSVRPVRVKK